MRAAPLDRRRSPRVSPLSDERAEVLGRFLDLRVMTLDHAWRLYRPWAEHSRVNAWKHLRRLVQAKYLEAKPVDLSLGNRSANFYQLTSKGVQELREKDDPFFRRRPPQQVLRYLLYRNDLYAAALDAGWLVASPTFTPDAAQPLYLGLFNQFALNTASAELAHVQQGRGVTAPPTAAEQRASAELERLPRFLPGRLTFEFLLKAAGPRPIAKLTDAKPGEYVHDFNAVLPSQEELELRLSTPNHGLPADVVDRIRARAIMSPDLPLLLERKRDSAGAALPPLLRAYRPQELLLLVIDDPRRAVATAQARFSRDTTKTCPSCGKPLVEVTEHARRFLRCSGFQCRYALELAPPRRSQLRDLPPAAAKGFRLCLRDINSEYDASKQRLHRSSRRLRQWRAALSQQFGAALLQTDTLFTDLWALNLRVPKSSTSTPTPKAT